MSGTLPSQKQSVVHQHERRRPLAAGEIGNDAVDGGLRRVHRRHDAADQPAVLDLEPVDGVPLVGHLADAQIVVQIGDDLGERHGADVSATWLFTTETAASVERSCSLAVSVPLCSVVKPDLDPAATPASTPAAEPASRVPAAIESAAALTRALRAAGTRLSSLGFGSYRTTPLASPNASTLGLKVPAFTSWATRTKARGRSMIALPTTRSGASAVWSALEPKT